ncbi:hypothetical protein H0H92_000778, partial [Tricholoma furcatifolium]
MPRIQSDDDSNSEDVVPRSKSGKRSVIRSTKQDVADKENLAKLQAAVLRAQKKLEQAKKTSRRRTDEDETEDVGDGPESEDESEILFSSS